MSAPKNQLQKRWWSRRGVIAAGTGGLAATMVRSGGWGSALAIEAPDVARQMQAGARRLLAALSDVNRQRVFKPFEDRQREDWHYTPRRRPGATLKQLAAPEQAALWAFLETLLSTRGRAQVDGTIKLERILGELTGALSFRDPSNYAIVLFGDPRGPSPFAWRFEGHHLSLSGVVVPGVGLAVTPIFFGANPATVPARHSHGGFRLLGAEEDAAFGLIQSLEGSVRDRAILSQRSLGDVVAGPGREDTLKRLEGVSLAALSDGQRDGVYRILELYLGTMRSEVARPAIDKVRQDGAQALHFAWAGSQQPGRPHYFRIHGPSVLLEYDNTQSGANHVHAVWIDPIDVFGRDLLKRHVKGAHGQ